MSEPRLKRLAGFHLGRALSPERWRLYTTPDLSKYFEFDQAETVHSERLSSGEIAAWLTPGAAVIEAAAVPSDFLVGPLAGQFDDASDSESLRRLLGLGLGICGGNGDGPKKQSVGDAGPCNSFGSGEGFECQCPGQPDGVHSVNAC